MYVVLLLNVSGMFVTLHSRESILCSHAAFIYTNWVLLISYLTSLTVFALVV